MHDDKFLGFRGQPVAKAIGVGRFREADEYLGLYDTRYTLTSWNIDQLFFGFDGQPVAKGFGIGRFRQYNETFTFYDTKRQLYDEVSYQVGTRRVVNRPREDDETTINHADRMRQHLISQFQWEVVA